MPYTESLELWTKLRANLDPKYRLGAPLTLKYTGGALPQAAFQEWYVSTNLLLFLKSSDKG